MEHTFQILLVDATRRSLQTIQRQIADDDGVLLNKSFGTIRTSRKRTFASMCRFLRAAGVSFETKVISRYDVQDILKADRAIVFGPLSPGFSASHRFESFSMASACEECGQGVVQTGATVLAKNSARRRGPFYACGYTYRIAVRKDIADEIVHATGQPSCFRPLVDRNGHAFDGWVKPVPAATLPNLHATSEGIDVKSECPACGRRVFSWSKTEPVRLMYDRKALKSASRHAVVAMNESFNFPVALDAVKRRVISLSGLPLLLFNRIATEVLMKYVNPTAPHSERSEALPVWAV